MLPRVFTKNLDNVLGERKNNLKFSEKLIKTRNRKSCQNIENALENVCTGPVFSTLGPCGNVFAGPAFSILGPWGNVCAGSAFSILEPCGILA